MAARVTKENIGVCNYIGHAIRTADTLPCCDKGKFPGINGFPGVQSHEGIRESIDRVWTDAFPSTEQAAIIERMKVLVTKAELFKDHAGQPDLRYPILPSRVLNEFSSLLAQIFGSGIMHRVDTFWSIAGKLRAKGIAGKTEMKNDCLQHQQVPRVEITIDPLRDATQTLSEWRERIFSVLVHELVHAYLEIYMTRRHDVLTFLMVRGIGGHGLAFYGLFTTLCTLLNCYKVLDIDPEVYLYYSVERDGKRTRRLHKLAKRIEKGGGTDEEIRLLIARKSGAEIDEGRASDFRGYRNQGYSPTEILLLLRWIWEGSWKRG